MNLNVYGQEHPHEALMIIGTPDGLRALAALLLSAADALIASGEFVASDGEGYTVYVGPVDGADELAPAPCYEPGGTLDAASMLRARDLCPDE